LQTILVLTGPQDLYKRWADKSKDLNVEWNLDAAKKVLETWQMSFTEVMKKIPGVSFCILYVPERNLESRLSPLCLGLGLRLN